MLKVINDFATELRLKYDVDEISIYSKASEKACFETGVEIDAFLLEKYFLLEKPQYVVSEGKAPLKDTLNFFSRFIFNTKTSNGLPLLFIISSKKVNYFDNSAHGILQDILTFKENM